MEIFGIPIKQKPLSNLILSNTRNECTHITTLNPEFLVEARKNKYFAAVLKNADNSVIDGVGLQYAVWIRTGTRPQRLSGVSLTEQLLRDAQMTQKKVFLSVRQNGLSRFHDVRNALQQTFPGCEIYGEDLSHATSLNPHSPAFKTMTTSDLVLCNFGAPYQEYFIAAHRSHINGTAVGVGGTFDYFTGKQKRAPRILQSFGLEWLWRALLQPHRAKRIWTATVVFPFFFVADEWNYRVTRQKNL